MAREKRAEGGNSGGRGKAAPGRAKGRALKPRKSVRTGARKAASPAGRSKRGRAASGTPAGFPLYHVAAFLSGIVLGRLVIR